jgi:hypothetical protein
MMTQTEKDERWVADRELGKALGRLVETWRRSGDPELPDDVRATERDQAAEAAEAARAVLAIVSGRTPSGLDKILKMVKATDKIDLMLMVADKPSFYREVAYALEDALPELREVAARLRLEAVPPRLSEQGDPFRHSDVASMRPGYVLLAGDDTDAVFLLCVPEGDDVFLARCLWVRPDCRAVTGRSYIVGQYYRMSRQDAWASVLSRNAELSIRSWPPA